MVSWDEMRLEARRVLDRLRGELLQSRNKHGHWEGHLSSSSLSTATAISAMSAILLHCDARDAPPIKSGLIEAGVRYLASQQNSDGGFGDTDRSHSNIATSYLVLAASELARQAVDCCLSELQLSKLNRFIEREGEIDGLRKRYGSDKTFVVPILNNLAIAGVVDWKDVPSLPFEAAAFPQSMYRFLRVPVVSYAIPALVAIGQAKHFHKPTWILPLRWARAGLVNRTLKVLQQMQPCNGGYLEAAPLTSFVVMSLAASNHGDHPVCDRGIQFLVDSVREDGSWPIDTNLATWVTSLSVAALAADPNDEAEWATTELADWILSCQHQKRHPFTGAEPGGWGWTDLSGAVPDGDDTPAAILALDALIHSTERPSGNPDSRFASSLQDAIEKAKRHGRTWLRQLQNRDGGMPTFCRGWGKLPFDRSSVDLAAHAIRAWHHDPSEASAKASLHAVHYLSRQQHDDGSWSPLWFGNQDRMDEDNPVYGTAKVLSASREVIQLSIDQAASVQMLGRGANYLIQSQNNEGGWGGGASSASVYEQGGAGPSLKPQPGLDRKRISTVEETAIAIEGLILFRQAIHGHENSQLPMRDQTLSTPKDPQARPSPSFVHDQDERGSFPHGIGLKCEGALSQDCTTTETLDPVILLGLKWLCDAIDAGLHETSFPIGFYFAKLWYHERLYPLVFSVSTLGRFLSVAK